MRAAMSAAEGMVATVEGMVATAVGMVATADGMVATAVGVAGGMAAIAAGMAAGARGVGVGWDSVFISRRSLITTRPIGGAAFLTITPTTLITAGIRASANMKRLPLPRRSRIRLAHRGQWVLKAGRRLPRGSLPTPGMGRAR